MKRKKFHSKLLTRRSNFYLFSFLLTRSQKVKIYTSSYKLEAKKKKQTKKNFELVSQKRKNKFNHQVSN